MAWKYLPRSALARQRPTREPEVSSRSRSIASQRYPRMRPSREGGAPRQPEPGGGLQGKAGGGSASRAAAAVRTPPRASPRSRRTHARTEGQTATGPQEPARRPGGACPAQHTSAGPAAGMTAPGNAAGLVSGESPEARVPGVAVRLGPRSPGTGPRRTHSRGEADWTSHPPPLAGLLHHAVAPASPRPCTASLGVLRAPSGERVAALTRPPLLRHQSPASHSLRFRHLLSSITNTGCACASSSPPTHPPSQERRGGMGG